MTKLYVIINSFIYTKNFNSCFCRKISARIENILSNKTKEDSQKTERSESVEYVGYCGRDLT
jgi:hypothetical protein